MKYTHKITTVRHAGLILRHECRGKHWDMNMADYMYQLKDNYVGKDHVSGDVLTL